MIYRLFVRRPISDLSDYVNDTANPKLTQVKPEILMKKKFG